MNDHSKNKKLFEETFLALLSEGRDVELPVFGLSMFPFILPGDVVRVSPVNYDTLQPGDVIVFENGGRLVAHRLFKLDVSKGWFVSKGDGHMKMDRNNRLSDVKGLVVAHYRRQRLIHWIHTPVLKKCVAFLSPLIGYPNYFVGLLWHKYFHRN